MECGLHPSSDVRLNGAPGKRSSFHCKAYRVASTGRRKDQNGEGGWVYPQSRLPIQLVRIGSAQHLRKLDPVPPEVEKALTSLPPMQLPHGVSVRSDDGQQGALSSANFQHLLSVPMATLSNQQPGNMHMMGSGPLQANVLQLPPDVLSDMKEDYEKKDGADGSSDGHNVGDASSGAAGSVDDGTGASGKRGRMKASQRARMTTKKRKVDMTASGMNVGGSAAGSNNGDKPDDGSNSGAVGGDPNAVQGGAASLAPPPPDNKPDSPAPKGRKRRNNTKFDE